MSQVDWENLASRWSMIMSLTTAVVMLVVCWFSLGFFENRIAKGFDRVAAKRWVCLILIPLLSFTVDLLIAVQRGVPRPLIHDEFSYLLAADTFAHGRVTNPTPPMAEHFETPQELTRPTYMSKYPPGQGIALAIGQVTTGQSIVGVWLSTAAACVAIYWMLLAFVPPRWALIGGVVAMLHPQLIDWSRVYWGGSVAVLGGALLLGAWGRLMQRAGVWSSIVLAVGLVILANSRPYEGLLLSAPLALSVFWRHVRTTVWHFVPAVMILLIAMAGMGYYNFTITGRVWRMPFVEYSAQYDVYPKFWFLPTRPIPNYHNESLRWVHVVFEKGQYDTLRTLAGFMSISWARFVDLVFRQAPLGLIFPLIIGLFTKFQRASTTDPRPMHPGLSEIPLTLAIFVIGLSAENFLLPHYAAPLLPATLLLIISGWHFLTQWVWKNRPFGAGLSVAIGIGFLTGAIMIAEAPLGRDSMIMGHAALAETPALQAGRHLVFVRYAPGSSFHNEYVFNDAEIGASRVVWARSLGVASDEKLAEQFPGREIWLLSVDTGLRLTPYRP